MRSWNVATVLGNRRSYRLAWRLIASSAVAWIGYASWPIGQASGPPTVPVVAASRLEQAVHFGLRGPNPARVDPRIVIVGFDTDTEAKLKANWPPSRAVLARAIDFLVRDGARVIAIDILLEGPTLQEEDKTLSSSLAKAPKTVLGSRVERDPNPRVMRKSLIGPYYAPDLGIDFESNAIIGLTEVPVDDDGIVRRFHPATPMLGEQAPSFALAVALKDRGLDHLSIRAGPEGLTFGETIIPFSGQMAIDPVDRQPIPAVDVNYPGGGASFPIVGDIADVAAGTLPRGIFKEKVVFVGVTGSQLIKERGDAAINAATARAPELVGGAYRRDMPGVVLQAHNYNAITKQLWLTPVPWWVRCIVSGILCWIGVGLAERFFDWRGVGALSLLSAGALLTSYVLFVRWAAIMPMLASTAATIAASLATGWVDRVRLRRRWAGYVSPDVMKVIIASDEAAIQLRCRATVLFADIRGFTSISEHTPPEDVVDLLNRHFARLVPIVSDHGGTVDKFMGDGLLAVFGAPVPFPDTAARAVAAAQEMLRCAQAHVVDRHGKSHALRIGIGVATGEVVAGEVGIRSRHDFTVIGEVVNLASRLQGETESGIVMDRSTADECGVHAVNMGERTIRGLASPVHCFSLDP